MFTYRTLRIGVVAALLIVLLAGASAPVQAQPVRPSLSEIVQVAGFGERVWHRLVSLWTRTFEQEGMSIDPNGGKTGPGVTASPNPPAPTGAGTPIGPDGRN